MAQVTLSASGTAGGPSVETNGKTVVAQPSTATLSVAIEGDLGLSDDAIGRISAVLAREALRFAQIAFVDGRDQQVAVHEAERIRALPKTRAHIFASIGRKDPESVVVARGEYEVTFGKTKRTLKAAAAKETRT